MIKKIVKSAKKVLTIKEQKKIVGGMCFGGGYPIRCCDGIKRCPDHPLCC
jgi:hypothetical protein